MTLLLAAFAAWAVLSFLIGSLVGRVLRFLDAPGEPSRADPGDTRPSPGSAFDAVQFAWPSVPYWRAEDYRPLLTLLTDNDKDAA